MFRLMNNVKTIVLLGAIMGLALLLGEFFGGRNGLIMGFMFGGLMNVVAYFFSDKIALASTGAREVTEAEAPELVRMVRELSERAGLPMPRVYISPEQAPNAFATGRNPSHAAVAVTEGLLNTMNARQIRGVLAHELGHVKHRDILIGSIAATMAGAITVLARLAIFLPRNSDDEEGGNPLAALLMMILAPVAAILIQAAISRSREYNADSFGGELCGNPHDLASALERLSAYNERIPMHTPPTQSSMFIVKPRIQGGFVGLFSSHPPIEKRIARLEEQAAGAP
jgi:heat shock protein HtpX